VRFVMAAGGEAPLVGCQGFNGTFSTAGLHRAFKNMFRLRGWYQRESSTKYCAAGNTTMRERKTQKTQEKQTYSFIQHNKPEQRNRHNGSVASYDTLPEIYFNL